MEKSKARWTAISIVVPLVAALFTVGFSVWSLREQAKLQLQTEVAKAIMQSRDSEEATVRADLLKQLFPASLPEKIDLGDFGVTSQYKEALFKSIAASKALLRNRL
jgi:hypothetical protein